MLPCTRHRWSANGACTRPGCRAERIPDQPLGSDERLHNSRTLEQNRRLSTLLDGNEVGTLLGVSLDTVRKMGEVGRLERTVVGQVGQRHVYGYDPHQVNSLIPQPRAAEQDSVS